MEISTLYEAVSALAAVYTSRGIFARRPWNTARTQSCTTTIQQRERSGHVFSCSACYVHMAFPVLVAFEEMLLKSWRDAALVVACHAGKRKVSNLSPVLGTECSRSSTSQPRRESERCLLVVSCPFMETGIPRTCSKRLPSIASRGPSPPPSNLEARPAS